MAHGASRARVPLFCDGPRAPHHRPDAGSVTPIAVPDAASSITLDGRLDEPAWAHAVRLSSFYETWPGDNVTPPVRTVAAITYGARFLYIGLGTQDPDPSQRRAALADRFQRIVAAGGAIVAKYRYAGIR